MSFVNDLKQGEEYEQRVKEALRREWWIQLEKNEDKKWIDLVHPIMQLEVKKDRWVNRTGNYFFEYMNNGKKWGIFAYGENAERATFFWVWNDDEFLLFYLPHLQRLFYEWIEDWKYRVVKNAGDGWRVSWILVPSEDLKQEAIYILNLNNNDNLH